nr:putative hemagglutinin/hemolysin-related protein [uncultured bacterium]
MDNDIPAIIYNYSALPIQVAEGATTNYSVVLATQPDSNVVIAVSSSATGIATVSPTNLTFTPSDWSTPKIVTITAIDDLVTNGAVSFNVLNAVTSTDPLYADFAGIRTLQGVRLDNETQLILPGGDIFYGLGMPAITIDGQAHIADVDAVTFNNGSLTVTLSANGNANDALGIRDAGTNAGQLSVSGADVAYEGNFIGGFTGGTNGTPLVITLNSNATVAAVQRLIRSVTFVTPTNVTSQATRTVAFALDDGVGGSATAAKLVHVGTMRLTQYQEGGDYGYGSYTGAADIALSEAGHDRPWPAGRTPAPQEGLLIDWPDGGTPNESQVLLRFDNFVGTNTWQVPSNAIVVSAELLIQVNNTGDGGRFFRMLLPWDAMNDTWDVWGGIHADDYMARSVYEAQLGVEDGSGATGTGIISVGVTPDVQAWVDGQTNFGWVIIGWPLMTDGTGFSPSEVPTVEERPRLRIYWLERKYSEVSFRQGANDYTNAHDVNIRQANPTLNYITDLTLFSDANDVGSTNNTQFLMRFDNIIGAETNQIPPGAKIHAAMLELPCVAPDSMGDGGRFYAMLQPWDDTTVTWSTFGPDGVLPDGVQAAMVPTVLAGNATLNPDVQGTVNTYDVTSDVQAWANGTRPNYGWACLPWPGGANGWGTRSSKFNSLLYGDPASQRPRLRVYYTASLLPMAAIVQPPVVSGTQVQVKFAGTASKTYTVLRAPAVTGPWGSIGTATTDSSGQASFIDPAPLPGGAFYQVVYP